MPTTGEICDHYILGICLGEGAFGAVYEATHRETGQRVALKFLHGTKELEPEVQNRFVREVAMLAKLNHQNIVRHYEAGLHDGSIYCAMELVECGSLKEVLQRRKELPWREAVEVALQLCQALEHAHDKGCVHRDLKPANLYLSEDGLVKLGDLGLARDLNEDRLTQQGQTVGTWRYMAPEQITGEENIDGRLDLYATGCILFEMIAGCVPFDGPDFCTIFDQHLDTEPPRLDVLLAECPAELADLVDELLKKSPDERPDSATVVVEKLEQLLSGTSSEGASIHRRRSNQIMATGVRDVPPNLTRRLQVDRPKAKKAKSNRMATIIVLVLLVIVTLFLAF